jgi:hypothetical protein
MTDILSARDEDPGLLEDGMALCLSGGGYRAMVFHVGGLIRLNEQLCCWLRRIAAAIQHYRGA